MDEIDVLVWWYDYNAFARKRYLATLGQLSADDLRRNSGAFYPLLDIFVHVLDAYRFWLQHACRDALRSFLPDRLRGRITELVAARREAEVTEREVRSFLAPLSSLDLDRTIEFEFPTNEAYTAWTLERRTLRVILRHLVEEELQHRGEMNALLWQLGVEPPITPFGEWWETRLARA